MTQTLETPMATAAGSATASQPPPIMRHGALGWMRANLFSSWPNALTTVIILAFLANVVPPMLDWAIFSAVWGAQPPEACIGQNGACWAFVAEKWRLMLFGVYPYAEQWRPAVATILMIVMLGASCHRPFWKPALIYTWVAALAVIFTLMFGGVFGMEYVKTNQWGGLPLTLGLSAIAIVVGFPIGIVAALGRRSEMPLIRSLCIGYIELIRGVPLITVLFMASVMFPLFLPAEVSIDKLLRAQIGLILFVGAYLAEDIRGGLQAIPKGQYEAADSLGLSYWQKTQFIVLPQALAISIPPVVSTFMGIFKDTTLVVIIGLFDLLNTARLAVGDVEWRFAYAEAYLFAASIFFAGCYFMSRYSLAIERRLQAKVRRDTKI